MAEEEVAHVKEGPVPVLKWDQELFEQIIRGFQFPIEWDARYPRQGQTVADAPPGYITLFAAFFLEGNFRLPATTFMASILHFYGFHISQMSPRGWLGLGILSFYADLRGWNLLLRNLDKPPKSFHDWKMKFFFIREEVMPIAMIFRESDKTEKEELPIPKAADWYMRLLARQNRIIGEQVLVTAAMSDKWPERSEEAAFPTFSGSMGVRPLEAGEAFANPPCKTLRDYFIIYVINDTFISLFKFKISN
ncbi:hypothetical protein Hanom_Chr04g00287571 [Helianthus anomalus]